MGKFTDRLKQKLKKGESIRLPKGYDLRWYQDQDFIAWAEHVYEPQAVKDAIECESREDVERFLKRQMMEVGHSAYRAGRQTERADILEALKIYLPRVIDSIAWLDSFVKHVLERGRYAGLARRVLAGETVNFDDADVEEAEDGNTEE